MAAIARATAAGYPIINKIIPQLLEWLRDYNWPVAQPTILLLSNAGQEIIQHIRAALVSDDDIWKYWIITMLYPKLKPSIQVQLRDAIIRIADHPSKGENLEKVDQACRRHIGRQNG